ncbi:hypothetical protein J437_LFUL005130 [Ladona fulva]|uniref:C3H1-type domain-containing protein n=1 Tax=Ladona fulva TaxID=123851 RepID=A0A8K0KHT1_LADFU|nr:hypothetical protein J437_LFUL005130 [Ladona fulva]
MSSAFFLTMGKRYYCDYCERTFIDDVQARKKHLLGLQHNLRVKQHYDSFKDAKTILDEELKKTPCHKFQRTGDCSFGLNCRHSHMTPERLDVLSQEVYRAEEAERLKKFEEEKKVVEKLSQEVPLPPWLLKKKLNLKDSESAPKGTTEDHYIEALAGCEDDVLANIILGDGSAYQNEMNHLHLPPSLRPMSVDNLMNASWEEWG